MSQQNPQQTATDEEWAKAVAAKWNAQRSGNEAPTQKAPQQQQSKNNSGTTQQAPRPVQQSAPMADEVQTQKAFTPPPPPKNAMNIRPMTQKPKVINGKNMPRRSGMRTATIMKPEVVYAGILTWTSVIIFIGILWWFSTMGTRLLVDDNMKLQKCTVTFIKGVMSKNCPTLDTPVFGFASFLSFLDWGKAIFLIQAIINVIQFRLLPHFSHEEEFSFSGFFEIIKDWLVKHPGQFVFCLLITSFDAGTTFRNLKETVTGWHADILTWDILIGPNIPFYEVGLIALAMSISVFSFMALVYAVNNLKEDISYL